MADWDLIEAKYKAGRDSVSAIARTQSISEGAIRKRAKKNGWVRDPAATVREKIKAHLAGASTSAGTASQIRTMMDAAAQSGIADMEYGLSNSRKILYQVGLNLSVAEDALIEPRILKTLNEANAGAIETIRRIRQLDEPAQKTELLAGFRMVSE